MDNNSIGFQYGPKSNLSDIYDALMEWRGKQEGVSPVLPTSDRDIAILHFPDGEVENWLMIQAVNTPEGTFYIYRRYYINNGPLKLNKGLESIITVDVMPTSNFPLLVGEIEDWFMTELPDMPDGEIASRWREVETGLYAYEIKMIERYGARLKRHAE